MTIQVTTRLVRSAAIACVASFSLFAQDAQAAKLVGKDTLQNDTLAKDEARHGGAYLRYMKRALTQFGDEARAAFSKVGVLMASARRTAQALHPTNLHVNKDLFPRDTIQSRLPDPQWLEHWLDKQINFDAVWETKVVERILHNMSLLMDRSFKNVQELNRFRKEITVAG